MCSNLNIPNLPSRLEPLLLNKWEKLQPYFTQLNQPTVEQLQQLAQVCLGSDFVSEQFCRSTDLFIELFNSKDLWLNYSANHYQQQLIQKLEQIDSEEELHQILRCFRNREQIRIIWRDLTRLASMQETTQDLSDLADACLDVSLDWLYQQACQRWGTPTNSKNEAQKLVVLGMGKLGAHELNLSSDIDLIFCFPEHGQTQNADRCLDNQDFFIKLGQKLIQALDKLTADGFVFRVDMRLRPFGSVSPIVTSFDAMEHYYQSQGREWERYALIKARPVAGDLKAGAELLQQLRPFMYRKYIDFGVIESLREMKGMINREVRRKGLENNVKLGAGGIREVEFIAQTFQLIRGGMDQRLQQPELLKILPLLTEVANMPEKVIEELTEAYIFLRNTEHGLQAVADRQTQDLPNSEEDQLRLAFTQGFSDWSSFHQYLAQHRQNVHKYFAEVVAEPEQENDEGQEQNSLLWLEFWDGILSQDETEKALTEAGFSDAQQAYQQLLELRESRALLMLQEIAQERMRKSLPLLMEQISQVENPNATLVRILKIISNILRRSAYLALLVENPNALKQLIRLCSSSPWFSEHLSKQPFLLDELMDQRTLYMPPNKDQIKQELHQVLLRIPEEDTERLMDALRYFKQAVLLRVAAADITGALPLMKVSDYLTWTAEAILNLVLDIAWRQLAVRHGKPATEEGNEPEFIILGYGKVGGIEMSYGSDMDLVFIHNTNPYLSTEGEKPITNATFFSKLGQRIIHMLNTFTASGQLYEVDMRLRPSGNSGLLVSTLQAFSNYQKKEAWTWEHQALVRSRVLAGSQTLATEFEQIRKQVLTQPRDLEKLRKNVVSMRQKMLDNWRTKAAKKPTEFDLKQDIGGIVDIEFIVQFYVLGMAQNQEELCTLTDNIRILEQIEQLNLLPAETIEQLQQAYIALRSASHRKVLENQPSTKHQSALNQHREAVKQCWQTIMLQTER